MADNDSVLNTVINPLDPQYTRELSIKIIEMYSERPILWNPRDPYYRVATMKFQAWQQIADECGLDLTTMRRKLNSLLASYRRERARIRQGKKSTWFLYDALKFIPNHVENDLSNETSTDDVFLNDEEFDDETEITTIIEDNDDEDVQYFDVNPTQDIFVKEEVEIEQRHKPKKMRTIYMRPEQEQHEPKFIKVPMERTETYATQTHQVNPIENVVYKSANEDGKDECDVFGEYIAKSLRKHNDKTRAVIKQAINNIIYEEEMKKYDTESIVLS